MKGAAESAVVCESGLLGDRRYWNDWILQELCRKTEAQLVDELRVRRTRGRETPLQSTLCDPDFFRHVLESRVALPKKM